MQFIREWFYLCHNVNLHSNRTSKSKIYITTSIIGRPVCIILNVYMYISNMYERSKIWHTKLLVFNWQKLNTGFFSVSEVFLEEFYIPDEGLSEYLVQNTHAGHNGFSFPSDPGEVATGLLVVGFESGLEQTESWESDGESLTNADSCLFDWRSRLSPDVEIVLEPFRTGENADNQWRFGGPNDGFNISSIEKFEHLGAICSCAASALFCLTSISECPKKISSKLEKRTLTFHSLNNM